MISIVLLGVQGVADASGVVGGTDIASKIVKVTKIDSADLRAKAVELGTNKDGDSVRGVVANANGVVTDTWIPATTFVNASGSICKEEIRS